jgi:hypothetical protein
MVLVHLGLKNGPFVPHNLIPVHGSPVTLLQFQLAPTLDVLWLQEEGAQTLMSE